MLSGGSSIKFLEVLLWVNGLVFKMAFLMFEMGDGCRIVMPLFVATITPG
jgi:hypothetical protein